MARITIEDCLDHVPNRFALVLMAAERTKQIMRGSPPLVQDYRENKEIVTALREIAAQKVLYYEKQVTEFDPAAEAEIRRAAQIRPIPAGLEPNKLETRPAAAEGDFEEELEDAELDEEFAEETDLDKLFSKLDSGVPEDDDAEDEEDRETDDEHLDDEVDTDETVDVDEDFGGDEDFGEEDEEEEEAAEEDDDL